MEPTLLTYRSSNSIKNQIFFTWKTEGCSIWHCMGQDGKPKKLDLPPNMNFFQNNFRSPLPHDGFALLDLKSNELVSPIVKMPIVRENCS